MLVFPYSKNTQITLYSEQIRRKKPSKRAKPLETSAVFALFFRSRPSDGTRSLKRVGGMGGAGGDLPRAVLCSCSPGVQKIHPISHALLHPLRRVCGGFETLRGYRRTPSRRWCWCWCWGWVLGARCWVLGAGCWVLGAVRDRESVV